MACKQCNQSNKDRDIIWDGEPGEYHIEVGDGYYNVFGIKYCPYCGEDLSKRKEESDKCVLTIQQEVQCDILTLGPQEVWKKIWKNIHPIEKPEYLSKKDNQMKKYKVLKAFPSSDAGYHHLKGATYIPTKSQTRTKNLLELGYIEETPQQSKTVWDLKEGDECYQKRC